MSIVLLILYILFGHKYKVIYNIGDSMHPTYYDREWIITEKIHNQTKDWIPKRYDIVIVWDTQERLTKRVIGLAGDEIEIKYGKIFLNGKELKDPYGNGDIIHYVEDEETRSKKPKKEWLFFNTNSHAEKIPEGHIWVIGDNREISWYGLIPIKHIKSLVVF